MRARRQDEDRPREVCASLPAVFDLQPLLDAFGYRDEKDNSGGLQTLDSQVG